MILCSNACVVQSKRVGGGTSSSRVLGMVGWLGTWSAIRYQVPYPPNHFTLQSTPSSQEPDHVKPSAPRGGTWPYPITRAYRYTLTYHSSHYTPSGPCSWVHVLSKIQHYLLYLASVILPHSSFTCVLREWSREGVKAHEVSRLPGSRVEPRSVSTSRRAESRSIR